MSEGKHIEQMLIQLGKDYYEKNLREKKSYDFNVSDEANALLNDFENTSHAFVLAALMDRQVPAERAWELPAKVKNLLGTFNILDLEKCSPDDYKKLFNENKLHRYNDTMADVFYQGVHRIIDVYDGDATKIWSDNPRSEDLVSRFGKFHGAGQKISTMAANILVRDFFVPVQDYKAIDVSADVHVCRVMKRTGLVETENRDEAIEKARKIYPEFPGIIDYPLWKIGKDICRPQNPNCANCPLKDSCIKNI